MNFRQIVRSTTLAPTSPQYPHQLSRRNLIKSGGIFAGSAAALFGFGQAAHAHHDEILTLDVACDGRTQVVHRIDPSITDQMPVRGDKFIVNGKIYPGGTIDRGLTGPDQAGSIGIWVCHGFFYVADLATEVPHVASTQLFLFDDGNGLTSEGLEGGIKTRRSITGGMGRWGDVKGDVIEEAMGENDTFLDLGAAQAPAPNIRFTFTMTPRG